MPMIASWPGHIQPNSTSGHISAFHDVMPTLTEIAGGTTPRTNDGISFLPTLLGQAQEAHDYLYWEFPAYKGQQAVRMGKWKGIRKNIFEGNMEVELYNLEEDIQEQKNISALHPDIVAQITQIMEEAHEPATLDRFKIKALGDLVDP